MLYENQPQETEDTFADNAKLIELMRQGRRPGHPAFQKCVNDGTHDSWVTKSNAAFQSSGFNGTPTVLLGGKNIYADQSMTPAKLKQMVEAENKG